MSDGVVSVSGRRLVRFLDSDRVTHERHSSGRFNGECDEIKHAPRYSPTCRPCVTFFASDELHGFALDHVVPYHFPFRAVRTSLQRAGNHDTYRHPCFSSLSMNTPKVFVHKKAAILSPEKILERFSRDCRAERRNDVGKVASGPRGSFMSLRVSGRVL